MAPPPRLLQVEWRLWKMGPAALAKDWTWLLNWEAWALIEVGAAARMAHRSDVDSCLDAIKVERSPMGVSTLSHWKLSWAERSEHADVGRGAEPLVMVSTWLVGMVGVLRDMVELVGLLVWLLVLDEVDVDVVKAKPWRRTTPGAVTAIAVAAKRVRSEKACILQLEAVSLQKRQIYTRQKFARLETPYDMEQKLPS